MGLYLGDDNPTLKKIKAAVDEEQKNESIDDVRDRIYRLENEMEAALKVISEEIEALKEKGTE